MKKPTYEKFIKSKMDILDKISLLPLPIMIIAVWIAIIFGNNNPTVSVSVLIIFLSFSIFIDRRRVKRKTKFTNDYFLKEEE